MAPSEAILSKKLDELESEVDFLEDLKEERLSRPRAAAIRSKLAFLKSLLAAETGVSSGEASDRLSRIAGRILAFDEPKSETSDVTKNSKKISGMKHVLLLKNLEELESAANAIFAGSPEPIWHPNSAKFLGKIAFTKSLLAAEEHGEPLSSMGARLAAVEEAFAHLVSTDAAPPSCSGTSSSSCHTEEVEEEAGARAPWLLSLRSKIEDLEQDINGDGYDDAQRKIRFFKSLLAAEMKWKGGEKADDFDSIVKRFSSIESEFADRNRAFETEFDASGGNSSSPCSCTSSCFDEGQDKEKRSGEEEEEGGGSVFGINETGESCSPEIVEEVEVNSETDDSEKGGMGAPGTGGGTRFGKLRAMGAMVGVFAVAVAGVVIGGFYSEVNPVYLVPT
ncbi:hypothetical protein KSP39_PZI014823 [Platanthera zijinensis]|uniref:DUF7610 domain-containing protein n=1 Tax=Platanthera zijinensis TaxID=2320716 RepID=A0AAP0BAQ5_9ASPA